MWRGLLAVCVLLLVFYDTSAAHIHKHARAHRKLERLRRRESTVEDSNSSLIDVNEAIKSLDAPGLPGDSLDLEPIPVIGENVEASEVEEPETLQRITDAAQRAHEEAIRAVKIAQDFVLDGGPGSEVPPESKPDPIPIDNTVEEKPAEKNEPLPQASPASSDAPVSTENEELAVSEPVPQDERDRMLAELNLQPQNVQDVASMMIQIMKAKARSQITGSLIPSDIAELRAQAMAMVESFTDAQGILISSVAHFAFAEALEAERLGNGLQTDVNIEQQVADEKAAGEEAESRAEEAGVVPLSDDDNEAEELASELEEERERAADEAEEDAEEQASIAEEAASEKADLAEEHRSQLQEKADEAEEDAEEAASEAADKAAAEKEAEEEERSEAESEAHEREMEEKIEEALQKVASEAENVEQTEIQEEERSQDLDLAAANLDAEHHEIQAEKAALADEEKRLADETAQTEMNKEDAEAEIASEQQNLADEEARIKEEEKEAIEEEQSAVEDAAKEQGIVEADQAKEKALEDQIAEESEQAQSIADQIIADAKAKAEEISKKALDEEKELLSKARRVFTKKQNELDNREAIVQEKEAELDAELTGVADREANVAKVSKSLEKEEGALAKEASEEQKEEDRLATEEEYMGDFLELREAEQADEDKLKRQSKVIGQLRVQLDQAKLEQQTHDADKDRSLLQRESQVTQAANEIAAERKAVQARTTALQRETDMLESSKAAIEASYQQQLNEQASKYDAEEDQLKKELSDMQQALFKANKKLQKRKLAAQFPALFEKEAEQDEDVDVAAPSLIQASSQSEVSHANSADIIDGDSPSSFMDLGMSNGAEVDETAVLQKTLEDVRRQTELAKSELQRRRAQQTAQISELISEVAHYGPKSKELKDIINNMLNPLATASASLIETDEIAPEGGEGGEKPEGAPDSESTDASSESSDDPTSETSKSSDSRSTTSNSVTSSSGSSSGSGSGSDAEEEESHTHAAYLHGDHFHWDHAVEPLDSIDTFTLPDLGAIPGFDVSDEDSSEDESVSEDEDVEHDDEGDSVDWDENDTEAEESISVDWESDQEEEEDEESASDDDPESLSIDSINHHHGGYNVGGFGEGDGGQVLDVLSQMAKKTGINHAPLYESMRPTNIDGVAIPSQDILYTGTEAYFHTHSSNSGSDSEDDSSSTGTSFLETGAASTLMPNPADEPTSNKFLEQQVAEQHAEAMAMFQQSAAEEEEEEEEEEQDAEFWAHYNPADVIAHSAAAQGVLADLTNLRTEHDHAVAKLNAFQSKNSQLLNLVTMLYSRFQAAYQQVGLELAQEKQALPWWLQDQKHQALDFIGLQRRVEAHIREKVPYYERLVEDARSKLQNYQASKRQLMAERRLQTEGPISTSMQEHMMPESQYVTALDTLDYYIEAAQEVMETGKQNLKEAQAALTDIQQWISDDSERLDRWSSHTERGIEHRVQVGEATMAKLKSSSKAIEKIYEAAGLRRQQYLIALRCSELSLRLSGYENPVVVTQMLSNAMESGANGQIGHISAPPPLSQVTFNAGYEPLTAEQRNAMTLELDQLRTRLDSKSFKAPPQSSWFQTLRHIGEPQKILERTGFCPSGAKALPPLSALTEGQALFKTPGSAASLSMFADIASRAMLPPFENLSLPASALPLQNKVAQDPLGVGIPGLTDALHRDPNAPPEMPDLPAPPPSVGGSSEPVATTDVTATPTGPSEK